MDFYVQQFLKSYMSRNPQISSHLSSQFDNETTSSTNSILSNSSSPFSFMPEKKKSIRKQPIPNMRQYTDKVLRQQKKPSHSLNMQSYVPIVEEVERQPQQSQQLKCHHYDNNIFNRYSTLYFSTSSAAGTTLKAESPESNYIQSIEDCSENDISIVQIASQRESLQKEAINEYIRLSFNDTSLFSYQTVGADFNSKSKSIRSFGFSHQLLELLGFNAEIISLVECEQLLLPYFLPLHSHSESTAPKTTNTPPRTSYFAIKTLDHLELECESVNETIYFNYPSHIAKYFANVKEYVCFFRFKIIHKQTAITSMSLNERKTNPTIQQYTKQSKAFLMKFYPNEYKVKMELQKIDCEEDSEAEIQQQQQEQQNFQQQNQGSAARVILQCKQPSSTQQIMRRPPAANIFNDVIQDTIRVVATQKLPTRVHLDSEEDDDEDEDDLDCLMLEYMLKQKQKQEEGQLKKSQKKYKQESSKLCFSESSQFQSGSSQSSSGDFNQSNFFKIPQLHKQPDFFDDISMLSSIDILRSSASSPFQSSASETISDMLFQDVGELYDAQENNYFSSLVL